MYQNNSKLYDVIVVGSGAAGLIAALSAAHNNQNVLLLEKLSTLASKLQATGGGKCNLSNTLDSSDFMKSFGKNGRFMADALKQLDHKKLMAFLASIGVDTYSPDGFRIFPTTHNSKTIIHAFTNELKKHKVSIQTKQTVQEILITQSKVTAVKTQDNLFYTSKIVLATGGMGYPHLGATGDGYKIVEKLGHTITNIYPAMMPVHTKQTWQKNCTADTIANATIKIDSQENKIKKLKATGDLIFTKKGLRGPVILDFSREITPFLHKYKEVPILINLTKGMNEDDIIQYLKKHDGFGDILPKTVLTELCKLANAHPKSTYKQIPGEVKQKIVKLLAWTPFTVVGNDGFDKAMITRGGVSLKEIEPKTMQSKYIKGLYFAGEIVDIDGPCGGYNLQWAFSSGYLAAKI